MHFQIAVHLFIALMISLVSCKEDCGNIRLQELQGEFMSPNYPNEYDHNANCSWAITAPEGHFIRVTFEEFDVTNPFWSCSEDYVIVIYNEKSSEKFCNDAKPPKLIKSTTNTLTFKLKSDRFFSNGDGFKAEYYVVDQFGNRIAGDDEDEDSMDNDSTISSTTTASATTTTNPTTTTKATTTTTKATTTTKPTTTTTVSTTTKPTTTTVSTTTKPTTTTTTTTANEPTTKKTTKSPKTTSVLIMKLASSIGTKKTSTTSSVGGLGSNDGISSNPGAISGVLIGGIVGAVLAIILAIAFVRYRRNMNKRIDLSVIEVADGKELISDDKVYKKQGKKIVRVPEAETFPL